VSTNSELRAVLGRLGPIPEEPRGRAASDPGIALILRRAAPIPDRVPAVKLLVDAGARLSEAHRAVTRLTASDWATCPVASHTNLPHLAQWLAALGIEVRVSRQTTDAATEIVDLRKRQDMSQAEYAAILNVDVRTLQNWEQGRNQPDSATLNLMRAFAHAPAIVEEAISEPVLG